MKKNKSPINCKYDILGIKKYVFNRKKYIFFIFFLFLFVLVFFFVIFNMINNNYSINKNYSESFPCTNSDFEDFYYLDAPKSENSKFSINKISYWESDMYYYNLLSMDVISEYTEKIELTNNDVIKIFDFLNENNLYEEYIVIDNLFYELGLKNVGYFDNSSFLVSRDLGEQKEILINHNRRKMDGFFKPGVNTLEFLFNGSVSRILSYKAVEKNYRTYQLFEKLCVDMGLEKNCYIDEINNFYYYDTYHFMRNNNQNNYSIYYRANIIESFEDYSYEDLNMTYNLASDWVLSRFDEQNSMFIYQYNPASDYFPKKNNAVRQLLSSNWLAKMALNNPGSIYEFYHKENLRMVFDKWYFENESENLDVIGYIYFGDKSKIATNSLLILTLINSPYYENYSIQIERLANMLIYNMRDDGSIAPWYMEPEYMYNEVELMYFYSGEAIYSLAKLYQKTNDEKYLTAAVKMQNYYYDLYINNIEKNFYHAYIPWHSMSMFELYRITGNYSYVMGIFMLNDILVQMQNKKGDIAYDDLGRFYTSGPPEIGIAFSGGDGIYLESLAVAYKLAEELCDKKRMEIYKNSMFLSAYNLYNMQIREEDAYYMNNLSIVYGGVKFKAQDNRLRIDTVQHAVDGLGEVLDLFDVRNFVYTGVLNRDNQIEVNKCLSNWSVENNFYQDLAQRATTFCFDNYWDNNLRYNECLIDIKDKSSIYIKYIAQKYSRC